MMCSSMEVECHGIELVTLVVRASPVIAGSVEAHQEARDPAKLSSLAALKFGVSPQEA